MSTSLQPVYTPDGFYVCVHACADADTRAPSLRSRRTGVLCVQPLFGEYIQHHRAFVLLAERLAAAGLPCLRFDHHGTGDSAGDLPDASVPGWSRAVDELAAALEARVEIDRIVIVGARFGASLALDAAARIVRTVGLVLWEPVWSGRAWLDSLLRTHRHVLGSCLLPDPPDEHGSWDVLGFEIPGRLWNEIAAFEPDGERLPPDVDVLVIGSATSLDGADRLHGHERVFTQPIEYPQGWLDPERGMYDVLVPADALVHIARWIEARS